MASRMDPVEQLLVQIGAQVAAALNAYADEDDEQLARAAMLLAADADQLAELVTRCQL